MNLICVKNKYINSKETEDTKETNSNKLTLKFVYTSNEYPDKKYDI